ncbi:MAG: hypothetical protein ACYTFD_19275 [Planctomycetota bacterium]
MRRQEWLARVLLVFGVMTLLTGCGGGETAVAAQANATVTGSLNLPAEASGRVCYVVIDDDLDAQQVVGLATTSLGPGTSFDFSFSGVPAGTYYVYAFVHVVSDPGEALVAGDFLGFHGGTLSDPPTGPNAVVPASGTVSFVINLEVLAELTVADLAGNWFGPYEDGTWTVGDPDEPFKLMSFTLDASGNLTQHRIDGVPTGLTATVDAEFNLVLSDGTKVGFSVADSGHMGYLDELESFGVLEKGATSLPSYQPADIVGAWSGFGFTLNSSFVQTGGWGLDVTVASDFTFSTSGSGPETYSGELDDFFDLPVGSYLGNYTDGQGGTGTVEAFMSPDKSCIAVQLFHAPWSFPEDFVFMILAKQ